MTDAERLETDREWREGISPLVRIICDVCHESERDCECAVQATEELTNE